MSRIKEFEQVLSWFWYFATKFSMMHPAAFYIYLSPFITFFLFVNCAFYIFQPLRSVKLDDAERPLVWGKKKPNKFSFNWNSCISVLSEIHKRSSRQQFFFLRYRKSAEYFLWFTKKKKKKLKLIGSKFRKTLIDFVHLLGRVRRIDWNFLTEFIESARLLRYVYNYSLLLSFTFPTFTQF